MRSNYISQIWRDYMTGQPYDNFNWLWNMILEPLDQANTSRKGWSRVFVFPLLTKNGKRKQFVVKKQQNYNQKSFSDPIHGRPTFEKEFFNIRRYKQYGIPTVEPMYFARHKSIYGIRSILITEYLEDYQPLNKIVLEWNQNGLPDISIRKQIISTVAYHIRRLHKARLVHRHLQLKHIFVRLNNEQVDVRFIDLEASQWLPFCFEIGLRDLITLNRSACGVGMTDRLRFACAYFGMDRLDRKRKNFCKIIINRTAEKNAKKHKRNLNPLI